MAIDRRTLLLGATAGAADVALIPRAGASAKDAQPTLAAACRTPAGSYAVMVVTPDGRELHAVPLPGRGHDLAVCPASHRIVTFARRPGRFAVVLDLRRRSKPFVFEAPADRHFYGHGVFTKDGRLLFTTENDFEGGSGVIGIWDAKQRFRRIGELPSHGIGPHDIALLSDGRTLVVANGGLREHPDIGGGRRVLNPHAIETSLAYLDLTHGDLLEKHEFPHGAGLSLRHFEIGADDTVVIGAQEQSPSAGARGIVYKHDRQHPLQAICCGEGDPLGGYVSSIAIDVSGLVAAVTSSRTGKALLIEIATGRIVGKASLRDVSGVAPARDARSFLLTSGTGEISIASASASASARDGDGLERARMRFEWDNHAVAIEKW